jgi:Na+-driven multidrug efflux pump
VAFARTCLPFILFNVINNLFHSFFRGVASAKLLLLSTAVGTVSRLTITFLLMERGMTAVFIGWIGSWIIEALFCLLLYFLRIRKQYARA